MGRSRKRERREGNSRRSRFRLLSSCEQGKRKVPRGGGAPCGTLGVAQTARGGVVVWPGTGLPGHVIQMNDVSSTILYARRADYHSTLRREGPLFSLKSRFFRFSSRPP